MMHMNTSAIKAIRLSLLALIILGLGLIAAQAYWVPTLVNAIIAHDAPQAVVPVATTTANVPVKPSPKPVPVPAPTGTSGVDGTVTIGPTCPVQQYPDTGACADKPYETTLVLASTIIGRNGGVLIRSDALGKFSHDLEPGTYTIRAQSSDMLPRLEPIAFTVEANRRTKVTLQFDSGIR